jgi:hypothetical protein
VTFDGYVVEELGDEDDDGTMVENVEHLRDLVVGHKIVSAQEYPRKWHSWSDREHPQFALTLDNGKRVFLVGTDDCCAYTELETFLLNVDKVDHIITGVGTTDGYTKWHIYCDFGDVLELTVGWSSGNPFYYGYGFAIIVEDVED